MVTINYSIKDSCSPIFFSLIIDGHAGFNPGNDIVCAGVSAITETLISLMEDFEEISILEESGHVEIEGKLNNEIEKYLHFAITGYQGISMTYPDNVDFQLFANK